MITYIFVALLIFLFLVFPALPALPETSSMTLKRDGVVVFDSNKHNALEFLSPQYEFIDYEYVIKSTSLTTFHRDVTSSARLHKCRHPVYTLIIYEYGGDLVSVCRGSHFTWPFVFSSPTDVGGPPGTAILFNSEILHAGIPNKCQRRLARQYKICHREDADKLTHLRGIRVVKDEKCVDNWSTQFKRQMSYVFAHPMNHWFNVFLMRRERDDTITGKIQATLGGDSQFYNNI
jgi:hypothetical protein